jgi:hypothetical protein
MDAREATDTWYVSFSAHRSVDPDLKLGETKLAPLKRGIRTRPFELLKTTNAARALNFGEYSGDSKWMRCKTVVSESLDECFVGTWVFAKSHSDAASLTSLFGIGLSTHDRI